MSAMPAKWLVAALFVAAALALAQDPPRRFQDTVSAERVVVDVHVIDNLGEPVLRALRVGLQSQGRREAGADRIARVDRRKSESFSRSRADGGRSRRGEQTACRSRDPRRDAVIVLFFQTDYEFSRITGQMRMIRQALAFLETCAPEDRLAVLSFDSRLKLRQDSHGRPRKLHHAIVRTLYADRAIDPAPGPRRRSPPRSISRRPGARHFRSMPCAVIGQGLRSIPGSKSLLYFGWGLGNFDPVMGLILDHNYTRALAALVRSTPRSSFWTSRPPTITRCSTASSRSPTIPAACTSRPTCFRNSRWTRSHGRYRGTTC